MFYGSSELRSFSNRSNIDHLALTCQLCGHTSLVSALSLIQKLGKDVCMDEVIPKARCGHCEAKSKATYVITYVVSGARHCAAVRVSGDAMLGAEQGD